MFIKNKHFLPFTGFTSFHSLDDNTAPQGLNMIVKVLKKTGQLKDGEIKDGKVSFESGVEVPKILPIKTVR